MADTRSVGRTSVFSFRAICEEYIVKRRNWIYIFKSRCYAKYFSNESHSASGFIKRTRAGYGFYVHFLRLLITIFIIFDFV
jgi:hypothetical protein